MTISDQTAVVTNSAGDVDTNGELVGLTDDLLARIGTAAEPGRYLERPGLDERLAAAGADVGAVRRMLRLER